jgi:hypothetical protein
VLTVEGIRAHLERLSYKDGWTFDVYEGRWEGQHIVIRTEIEDAALRGRKVVLDVHSMLRRSLRSRRRCRRSGGRCSCSG